MPQERNPGKIKSEKISIPPKFLIYHLVGMKNSLMRTTLQDLIERQSNCKLITGTRAVDFISRDDAAYVNCLQERLLKQNS